jgi:hypothetical protein
MSTGTFTPPHNDYLLIGMLELIKKEEDLPLGLTP